MSTRIVLTALGLALGAAASLPSLAYEPTTSTTAATPRSKVPYSPYVGTSYPTRPYFGDTHLHTAFSMDAGAFGARLSPRDAYRFARGEEIAASSGQPAKLSRPLDFLVVADHSDNMGFFPDLFAGKPEIMADPTGRKWHDMIVSGQGGAGGHGDHQRLLAGHVSEGPDVPAGHARL